MSFEPVLQWVVHRVARHIDFPGTFDVTGHSGVVVGTGPAGDTVRATCDAILVGANTVRRDNPWLLVRSACRVEDRPAAGLSGSLVKVTVMG